jgi:hypothetical protein
LIGIKAISFPDGIQQAFDRLHQALPNQNLPLFGMSRPEHGMGIQYRACTFNTPEIIKAKESFDTLIIPKGKYVSLHVESFPNKPMAIKDAFEQLLKQPGIDPEGYCIEMYKSDTSVDCMVRLLEYK